MIKKNRYEDILNAVPPVGQGLKGYPPMNIPDRAKIFAPFAALKGYEEAILAKQKVVVPRIKLSEETRYLLDQKMHLVLELLKRQQHPILTIIYFARTGAGQDEGEYIRFTGMVGKIDETSKILHIVDLKIPLYDIYNMEGELFDDM